MEAEAWGRGPDHNSSAAARARSLSRPLEVLSVSLSTAKCELLSLSNAVNCRVTSRNPAGAMFDKKAQKLLSFFPLDAGRRFHGRERWALSSPSAPPAERMIVSGSEFERVVEMNIPQS